MNLFGTWVENKLGERDKKGKPKHRIENLLMPAKRRMARRKVSANDFMARGVPVTFVPSSGEGS